MAKDRPGFNLPRAHLLCTKCGQVKPRDQFGFYALGARKRPQIKPYCLACSEQRLVRKIVRGQGPHKIPHPCTTCGKEFWLEGHWSHVRHRKVCSDECFKAPRRMLGQSCTRCKKDLPREAFDVRPEGAALQRTCRKCVAERDRDRKMLLRTRPTSFQMWRTAKMRAGRRGYAFTLTQAQARTLYRGKCCLCGRAPSSLQPAHEGPMDKDNVRPYCRRCARLLVVYDHQELFLLAHEIAAHNPLTSPEVPDAK